MFLYIDKKKAKFDEDFLTKQVIQKKAKFDEGFLTEQVVQLA